MLDRDLADLYGVETRGLTQAVQRNLDRFPEDFMFQLTPEEAAALRSQAVTLEKGRGRYSKYAPLAFTEHGVAMLSSVLNSKRAVQMNILIIRAFVNLREVLESNKALARKVVQLEAKQKDHAVMLALVVKDIESLAKNVKKEFRKLREPRRRRARIGFLTDKM